MNVLYGCVFSGLHSDGWFLVCCSLSPTQSGWLDDLQLLGYKDPLHIPVHLGIQAVLATIKAPEIHKFIQEHDYLVLDGSEKGNMPLLLEILGMQEFCDITFMACKDYLAIVIRKLKSMSDDLPNILDHDDKDMNVAHEKAKVIVVALGSIPRNGATLTLNQKSVGPSQL